MPSPELLRGLFLYDRESGRLSWRHAPRLGRVKAGEEAGSIASGYRRVKIDGVAYPAHRVIWKLVTGTEPSAEVDHCDTNKLNNRWLNLRNATRPQNASNIGRGIRNRSGLKGVSFHKQKSRWYAQIMVGGKCRSLGLHATAEAAHAAYSVAAISAFGEYARTQ